MTDRAHAWTFLATSSAAARTVVPVTIAVCTACGRIRAAVAIPQRETAIDLGGTCPGAPATPGGGNGPGRTPPPRATA